MKQHTDQWVIKIQTDQVKGPYSTETVIKMILNGVFSGTEEISGYPEGEWQILTKQPEFYDALLESLENPLDVDQKRSQKMDAETVVRISVPTQRPEAPKPSDDEPLRIQNQNDLKAFVESALQLEVEKNKRMEIGLPAVAGGEITRLPENKLLSERDKKLEIQLTDIQKLKKQELRRLIPFIGLLAVLLLVFIYFAWPSDSIQKNGWTLSAPKKNTENKITEDEVKNLKRRAVRALQSGLYEQILTEQSALIKAIEGAPRDLEAMGLLCVVYEQLWPYTRQTANDLKSILTVAQMARNINPVSNYSDTCQGVFLLTKGQSREARSLIERVLDNPVEEKFSLSPFLYLIKAEILESEGNYINAEAYYDQATQLWPQWQTARFGLGRMLYRQSKFSEAREQFAQMHQANKEMRAALLGLGLVESRGLKDNEKALSYFNNAAKLKQTLQKDFLVEALLNYSQLLIDKDDTSLALTVAQEGYRLSPSHRALKEIVISLGGSDKVANAESEVILIGDQFARAGDHMVAQAQYKAAFELDPKNAVAAFKAAKSLWAINQSRDALNWLDKSINADPKFIQAYILKADYESQKYNFAAASRTLLLASRQQGQSHEIMKAQALLEFRKNNMIGAIQYGERAVKIYNADVELLSMLAQAYIYFYMNAPSVGKEAVAQKEDAKVKAQRYAQRAIDLEPAWPEAQITKAKSIAAFEVNGPTLGETYIKEFIKVYPYTMEYRIALAEYYAFYERYSEAATLYEEIVKIEPKNKKANFGLAEAYRILNKTAQAQKYYNITSLLDPSDVEPMFSNAKLLVETASGNELRASIEQALAKFELVRKINPDFPKVSYMIAKCYLELGDYERSMEMIKEEKSRNPNIADSYILAAEIFSRKNQYKECAAEYSAAIKIRPNKAELYVRASACYRNSDAVDIAQDMVDMAFQRESGFAENFREQGYVAEKTGDKARAVTCLKLYLNYSPNALDRSTVESKIRQLGEDLNGTCRP